MAEPTRVSALSGHLHATRDAGIAGGPRLGEIRPCSMIQVLGAPRPAALRSCLAAHALAGEPGPGRCVRGEHLRVLWNGPDQYLLVSARDPAQVLLEELHEALHGHACSVVDLSHARTVLRVEGPHARDVLAKGCPLDVDAMRPGAAAATVLSHFNILLHCDGEEAFELFVPRSFGLSCFEWLCLAGGEFGMSVI